MRFIPRANARPITYNLYMPRMPYLIFDKSSLESLNIDESVLLDTFYSCVITPIFFVECLADLEKKIEQQEHPGAARRFSRRQDA